MTMQKRANSMLVVAAWINSISELRPGCAAGNLPEDNSTWGTSGFALLTVVAGNHHIDNGQLNRPVVQVDCYAIKPGTSKPLWGTANAMISSISAACVDDAHRYRLLTLPNGFGTARVLGAYQLSEEKQRYRDDTKAAIVSADFRFYWREL